MTGNVIAITVRICLLLTLLLCPLSLAAHIGGDRNVYRLLVLHTNDMHAHFEQGDRIGGQCLPGKTVGDGGTRPACYGGFPRLKTAVDGARAQAAQYNADGTLFLNAGDTFQGTAFYTYLKWPSVAQMIQPLGLDVMVSIDPRVILHIDSKFSGSQQDFRAGFDEHIWPSPFPRTKSFINGFVLHYKVNIKYQLNVVLNA